MPKLLDYDSLAVSQAEFGSEGFGNHKKLKKAEKKTVICRKKGNRCNKIAVTYIIMEMTSEEVMVNVKM